MTFTLTLAAATPPPRAMDFSDPYTTAALAVGALTLIYLLLVKPAKDRRWARKDPLASMPQKRSLAHERSTERAMQSLVLDLEALSRRMGGELDAKSARLDALIVQADAASARLEAAVTQAGAGDKSRTLAAEIASHVAAGRSGPSESGLAGLAGHRDIYAMADAGEKPDTISRRTGRPAGEVELILALRGL